MSKRIKIVWTNEVSHYDSEYEYTTNYATIIPSAVVDWEEISDEDFTEITGNWRRISDHIKGKSKLEPLLLIDTGDVRSFDCLKALKDSLKADEARREAERLAEQEKKHKAKEKKEANRKLKDLADLERLAQSLGKKVVE